MQPVVCLICLKLTSFNEVKKWSGSLCLSNRNGGNKKSESNTEEFNELMVMSGFSLDVSLCPVPLGKKNFLSWVFNWHKSWSAQVARVSVRKKEYYNVISKLPENMNDVKFLGKL